MINGWSLLAVGLAYIGRPVPDRVGRRPARPPAQHHHRAAIYLRVVGRDLLYVMDILWQCRPCRVQRLRLPASVHRPHHLLHAVLAAGAGGSCDWRRARTLRRSPTFWRRGMARAKRWLPSQRSSACSRTPLHRVSVQGDGRIRRHAARHALDDESRSTGGYGVRHHIGVVAFTILFGPATSTLLSINTG